MQPRTVARRELRDHRPGDTMHDCGHEHEEMADGADAAGTDGCAIDREMAGPDEGRRAFLRDGLLAVAAITLVSGAAAPLEAMTRRYATGIASTGALATVTYPVPKNTEQPDEARLQLEVRTANTP